MSSLQVKAISLEVACLGPGPYASFPLTKTRLDCLDDSGSDLVLHREDIDGIAIESFRPELVAARHIGELGGDAQPVSGGAHATLEHVVHRKRASDRREVAAIAAGAECRGSRRHADSVDPYERAHDLLGHPFAEVLLILCRAHIRERQHRDRNLRNLNVVTCGALR
jgi:hypothetical protein